MAGASGITERARGLRAGTTGEGTLVRLGGAGHEVRADASYFHDCQKRQDRPHVVVQYTLAGCAYHESRATGRRLVPVGWAFVDVIPGPARYGWAPESGGAYEQVYVSLVGPLAQSWRKEVQQRFGPVVELGVDSSIAATMLTLAREYVAGELTERFAVAARLYALMMAISDRLSHSRLQTAPQVAHALELIQRHAGEAEFNVQQLAERLGYTREHLTRCFQAATGLPPSEHLMRRRLELAVRHLRAGDDKLARIAPRAGFASANYLCRAFRQRFGVTPARFRATPGMIVM